MDFNKSNDLEAMLIRSLSTHLEIHERKTSTFLCDLTNNLEEDESYVYEKIMHTYYFAVTVITTVGESFTVI